MSNTDEAPSSSVQEYRGHSLDRFQSEAIHALQQGHSVLVCAPTGTGKTMVADWLVEDALARGKEVIYTAPVKALSNQKFRDYCKLLGEERVGLVTGDLVIRRDAPCRVMTTEILRNMLLSGERVPDLAAVIIDEIHFLDDRERGTTWEEVLIYLPSRVRIVGLSATLSNVRQFSSWLSEVRGHPVSVVEEYKRAVPLTFRVATREGRLRTPKDMGGFYKNWARKNAHRLRQLKKKTRQRPQRGRRNPPRIGSPTRHTDIFDLLWPDHAPYLYFVFSRRDTESMARSLVRQLDFPLLNREERDQVRAHLDEFCSEPGAAAALDPELAFLYRTGVAFHHAGLHVHLKALVEELYERRLIKVLYCTGTFALGINMPARTAVFDRLERYDGRGMIPLPAREFMQMAGRAGRRGLDDEGLVVTRCPIDQWPDLEPQLTQYLQGRTEPVRSRFGL
ncbi:MAG TPA: helicase, partial [Deltaproteobacteria bacterium]|nr:helicase [Deltaproteobacteria bacterium]